MIGEPLLPAKSLRVTGGAPQAADGDSWVLQGVTSNDRYVNRPEKSMLTARQPPLGRADADCAALIPIRKTDAWWALTQDERRQIFEERSGHTKIGLKYLPAVARRLHHCRDLGQDQPFDFLTWFEFSNRDRRAFEDLLGELRATPEWEYVSREIDIRLEKIGPHRTGDPPV